MSASDEFDAVASWTVDAIERLGADHGVPGACRGSGGPGALAWLADWLVDAPPGPFLDLGGGLGGPSAWLAERHRVEPVVSDPMAGAVAGARRLFGLAGVRADGAALPFATDAVASAWCLGVLSTVPSSRALLAEAARVLRPAARLGLVAYLSTGDRSVDEPEGNYFPTRQELDVTLAATGFRVVASTEIAHLPAPDPAWDDRADAVDRVVAEHHRHDPAWQRSVESERQVADLLDSGRTTGVALRTLRSPA